MNDADRLDDLRRRSAAGGTLTDAERQEVDAFYRRFEGQDASALARLQRRKAEQEEVLRQLNLLRERKRESLDRLQALAREVESIGAEEERLIAAARS